MNPSYEKLTPFQTDIGSRLTNMSGRTPSFIVVGLVIIMFLLGLFYMSCSSKNTELRLSLEQFEERIRSLTMKNSDADKKFEDLSARKRELEEEKLTIRRQMEKKDSEVNDLNTKLNERKAELESLKSDKQVLDQQLKEYKSLSETVASKNSLIERLQQQLNEQKQFGVNEQSRLQQEIDTLKTRGSQNNAAPPNEPRNPLPVANQRYQPLIGDNVTTRSIAGLFQNPLDKFNNLTREIKAQIIPAAIEAKEKVLNVLGVNTNGSNNAPVNQQQEAEGEIKERRNAFAGPNVPVPPLADIRQQQQQEQKNVESAQAAPKHNRLPHQDREADRVEDPQRQQEGFNNAMSDKKKAQLVNDINNNEDDERDDEEQVENEAQQRRPLAPSNALNENRLPENNARAAGRVPPRLSNEDNYRVAKRERFQPRRTHLRSGQQSEHGEEVVDENNERRAGQIRKRNAV